MLQARNSAVWGLCDLIQTPRLLGCQTVNECRAGCRSRLVAICAAENNASAMSGIFVRRILWVGRLGDPSPSLMNNMQIKRNCTSIGLAHYSSRECIPIRLGKQGAVHLRQQGSLRRFWLRAMHRIRKCRHETVGKASLPGIEREILKPIGRLRVENATIIGKSRNARFDASSTGRWAPCGPT